VADGGRRDGDAGIGRGGLLVVQADFGRGGLLVVQAPLDLGNRLAVYARDPPDPTERVRLGFVLLELFLELLALGRRQVGRQLGLLGDLGVGRGVLERAWRTPRAIPGAAGDRLRTAGPPFLGTFAIASHGSC
jgi:hypothetical protein